MKKNGEPDTLAEWAFMVDGYSSMNTWDALLKDSSADMRRSVAQDLHTVASSIAIIERRRILEALSPIIRRNPFDQTQSPEGIDDRFFHFLSTEEWIDYCMSVATNEQKNNRSEALMKRRQELLEDRLVQEPIDFLDEETAELVAETRVLAREVLARTSLPFLRDLGLGEGTGYSAHEIYEESASNSSLLLQPKSSHIQVLQPV